MIDDALSWLPEHLRLEMAERLAARPVNGDCQPVCGCGAPVGETEFSCGPCVDAERAEQDKRARHRRVFERVTEAVQFALAPAPRWPWARAGQPDFLKNVPHSRLQGAAAKWLPIHGNLALLGVTGCGKTATATAIVHRLAAQALAAAQKGDRSTWQSLEFVWTSGPELATARRKFKLGDGDAPLVQRASEVAVLVIDELGYEVMLDTTVAEVVDARYRAELPTIITSGLTVDQFRGRYGDATWRKIAQRGAVIETWGAGG